MKFFGLLLICLLLPVVAIAQNDFRPLVKKALQNGEKRIVIAPGVYRLAPETEQSVIWTLRDVQDVEIIADGVTLIGTKLTRALQIDHCRNVTLQGLKVDYDPLPFTQGTVVSQAPDKSWIDIKIHDGYPRQPYARIDVVDPQTRYRKKGMPFLWGTKAEMSAPDTVRITLKGIADAAAIGDLASLSTGQENGGVSHGITVENCASVTLRDVTLHCAPGMGILEADGEGRAQFLGCKIVRGPKPQGATEERLLTTSWDAMQSKTIKFGPRVENCIIEDAGDDSWSVQSSDFLVVKRDGTDITLASRDEWTDGVQIGDRLRTSLNGPEAKIIARKIVRRETANLSPEVLEKLKAAPNYSLWSVSPKCFELTLDKESPFQIGDSVFDIDRQGNGFKFVNNKIHSAGRILIKAGGFGVIADNDINTPHNITICPEVPGDAAAGIKSLIIRNNTIREAGYFCPAPWSACAGALSITAGAKPPQLRGAGIFDGLLIEGNIFENCNGPNLVISSARNVIVRDNKYIKPQQTKPNNTGASYGIAANSVVWISDSEKVQMTGDQATETGRFAGQPIVVMPSVKP